MAAPLAAAAEDTGDAPVVDDTVTTKLAVVADDPAPVELDAPKAVSPSDEPEAPAPKRQTHRRAAAASSDSAASDNDSDSGSHASRRHAG